MAKAYSYAGQEAVAGYWAVMEALIPQRRARRSTRWAGDARLVVDAEVQPARQAGSTTAISR